MTLYDFDDDLSYQFIDLFTRILTKNGISAPVDFTLINSVINFSVANRPLCHGVPCSN